MKKLLLFGAISIFSFSGCFIFGGGAEKASDCTNTDPVGQDRCLVQLAITEKDEEACKLVQDPDQRASCWLEIAIGTGDVTACDNLVTETRDKCISDYSNTGLFNVMPKCESEHDDVDACLIRLAGIKNNPIPCERTADYNACLFATLEADKSDRSPCDNVKQESRYRCIVGSAQIFKDDEYCERLNKEEKVQQCKDELDDSYKNAAQYYATLICVLNDPSTWEGFWDGEEAPPEDGDYTALLNQFGYASEAASVADLNKHWEKEPFKQEVRDKINSDCPNVHNLADFDLETLLSQRPG